MGEYSQLGQDRFVLRLLGFPRHGFFLDSGASDGVSASNTYLLETEYDWRGICVEPNSNFYNALVKNRHAFCVNCCLYDSEGAVDFLEAGTLGGVLNDYHPTLLAQAARTYPLARNAQGNPATVSKPSRTVSSVLAQFRAPQVIDYWSLDTEGSELRILKSFPFGLYRVRVITVEHNRHPVRMDIWRFLQGHGYVLAMDFGIDDCYVESPLIAGGPGRRRLRRFRSP
jgi:FkbM family methyltransferase